jgi:hypothetical protein
MEPDRYNCGVERSLFDHTCEGPGSEIPPAYSPEAPIYNAIKRRPFNAAARRVPRFFNPAVHSFLEQAQARLLQQTGDPAAAQQLALQALENLRQQQASSLAYFDCFWLFAVLMLAVTLVVLVMKRSVAEKGARVGGEWTDVHAQCSTRTNFQQSALKTSTPIMAGDAVNDAWTLAGSSARQMRILERAGGLPEAE